MTHNQIAWANTIEAMRANRARELETNRSNIAHETEAQRHNLAYETELNRSNRERERVSLLSYAESKRSNEAREKLERDRISEMYRSNLVREAQGWSTLQETRRSNLAQENLTRTRISSDNYHRSQDRLAKISIADRDREQRATEAGLRHKYDEHYAKLEKLKTNAYVDSTLAGKALTTWKSKLTQQQLKESKTRWNSEEPYVPIHAFLNTIDKATGVGFNFTKLGGMIKGLKSLSFK